MQQYRATFIDVLCATVEFPNFPSIGEPQSFEVKFKRVEDYPIDLYYLMDLSFSMEDDLLNVKKLGADLMEEMKNITSDFRMGLCVSFPCEIWANAVFL